jgi:hypothetical protein
VNMEKLCFRCKINEKISSRGYCVECARDYARNFHRKNYRKSPQNCINCKQLLIKGKRKFCSNDCILNFFIKKDENNCWLWKGPIRKDGVPTASFFYNGKMIGAKVCRWMYEKEFGEIEKNKFLIHRCQNNCCVNPSHLMLVSKSYFYSNCKKGYSKYDLNRKTNPYKRTNPMIIEKIIELHECGYNSHEISNIYNNMFHTKFADLIVKNMLREHPPLMEIFDDILKVN